MKKIGSEPPSAGVGETIDIVLNTGGKPLYWTSLEAVGEQKVELIEEKVDGNTKIRVERVTGTFTGSGTFNVDFLIYHWLGIDLSNASKATIETLKLPPRLLLPFVILILVSLLTRPNSKEALDRYYVKMKTPVDPDPETDRKNLEESYSNPKRFEDKRLLPGTNFEMLKPTKMDVLGFLAACGICFLIISLLTWLAGIGS